MILLDIDGCITAGKGFRIDLVALQSLNKLIANQQRATTICTGRSAPYVEAIAQMLDIQTWTICENGAYLYHTVTHEIVYHPDISIQSRHHLQEIKQILITDSRFSQVSNIEMGKDVCISLNPINISIENLYHLLKDNLNLAGLHLAHSTTAVDITPQSINKGSAIGLLCKRENLAPKDLLGVGDSMGDLSFLQLCGQVACPNNAIQDIKDLADFVSVSDDTQGVVEIYQWLS